MAENGQKRQTAMKLSVCELLDGMYIKEEGLRPNYVLLKDGTKVSRVNILGVIISVSTENAFQEIVIDDGSGQLSVRSFEKSPQFSGMNLGDTAIIIGRPRNFNNSLYLLPEIIRPLQNKMWLEVRKLELGRVGSGSVEGIIGIVKTLDKGDGAPYELICAEASNADKILSKLLETGTIFEVSPGKLKVLD